MALSSGTRLGPYEIMSLAGAGGMGEVYRAHDPRLGRDVAVKVLPTVVSDDVDRLRRFKQEARAAAGVSHPNILAVYDIGSEASTTFVVSELLEGQTLRDLLRRGPLPYKKAADYTVQIALGLAAAHVRGIVHRDLKPENVFVTADGGVKILDFGLAKLVERPATADAVSSSPTTAALTSPGLVVGTVGYMAPEQVRGQAVDSRTDIFALGCVMYEMLSGTRAFAGSTAADTMSAILNDEPTSLTRLSGVVPPGVERIVQHCLEKDPIERFQSARDVVFALREQGSSSVALPSLAGLGARLPHRRRVIAGALVALVSIASVWFALRDRTDPPSLSSSTAGPTRLVVLPFENLSRQPGDDWLASAFSDSLTLGLRDVENIVVVSRERLLELDRSGRRSQALDATNAQQLSRLLDVRYYVTGTYQRVDGDVRVVARMVEGESGAIKVQESLTDRYANLLKIEDDLARRFAGALQNSPVATPAAPTASLAAYRAVAEANTLYLAGRYRETIQRLEGAIAQDERYADAWALLGKSYARLSGNRELALYESSARREYQEQALGAAQKAVDLNPTLYEAQIALALANQAVERVEPWRIAAQKAIDLNPRLADGYVLMADSYRSSSAYGCGRQRDPALTEQHLRRALELDPRSGVAYLGLIAHLTWGGRETEALRVADDALALLPDNVIIMRQRSVALIWLGKADEAEQQLLALSRASAASVQDEFVWGAIELLRGRRREAAGRFQAVIERGPLTLTEIDTSRIYSQAGRLEDALPHLERALAADATCATYVANSPAFAPYRDAPAFTALLDKYRRKEPQ